MRSVHIKALNPNTKQEVKAESPSTIPDKVNCNLCEFVACSEKDMEPHMMSVHIKTINTVPVTEQEDKEESPTILDTILDGVNIKNPRSHYRTRGHGGFFLHHP